MKSHNKPNGSYGAKHKMFESKNKHESKDKNVDSRKPKPSNETNDRNKTGEFSKSRSPVTCYTCGKVGHKSFDCNSQKSQTKNDKTAKKSAACQAIKLNDQVSLDNQARSEHNSDKWPWPTVAVASQVDDIVNLKDLRSIGHASEFYSMLIL